MTLFAHLILLAHSFITGFPHCITDAIISACQSVVLFYLSFLTCILLSPFLFLSRYLPHAKFSEQYETHRQQCQGEPEFRQRTILITGVNSIKGIFLARSFYLCGHSVIGADFECHWRFSPARFSRALRRFYPLPLHLKFGAHEQVVREYSEEIIDLIDLNSVDLWISCFSTERGVLLDSQARQFVEEKTRCRCVQFDYITTVRLLTTSRTFFDFIEKEGGLSPLESHRVTSTAAIRCIQQIRGWSGRDLSQKFTLRPARRSHILTSLGCIGPYYLSEIMEQVGELDISRGSPWILEQYVCGGKYYRSHSLIVRGQIATFYACPIQSGGVPSPDAMPGARLSRRPGFYHTALDAQDWLCVAMREFTDAFIKMISSSHDPITGHLTFDYVLDTSKIQLSRDNLYVLSCGTSVRTAIALFAPSDGMDWKQTSQLRAMVNKYLSILTEKEETIRENLTSSWDSIRSNFQAPRYTGTTQTSSINMTPELENPAPTAATRDIKWHLSRHDSLDYCYEDGDDFPSLAGPSQPIPPQEADDVTPQSNLPTPPSTPPTSAQNTTPETTTTTTTSPTTSLLDSEILSPKSDTAQDHRYLASHHLIARVLAPLAKLMTGQITSRSFYNSLNKFVAETTQWQELVFEVWDPVPFFLMFAYSMVDAWWSHSFLRGRKR